MFSSDSTSNFYDTTFSNYYFMNHGLLPILVVEVFLYEIGNNTILKQTDTLLFMTVTNRHSKNKVIIMATSSLLWPIYWCRAGKFTLWKHNKWNIFQAIPRQLKNQRIYLPNPLAVNLISLSQISFPTLMFFFSNHTQNTRKQLSFTNYFPHHTDKKTTNFVYIILSSLKKNIPGVAYIQETKHVWHVKNISACISILFTLSCLHS